MKSSYFSFGFAVLLFLVFGTFGSIDAQVTNKILKKYGCIDAVLCNSTDANYSRNDNCPANQSDEHDVYPHRSRVFNTTPLDPNAMVYVTECIETGNGYICTTGSSELDKQVFCPGVAQPTADCDHYQLLRDHVPGGYIMYPDRNWMGYTVYYSSFTNYSSRDQAIKVQVDLTRTANESERHGVTTDSNGRLPIIEWQSLTPGYSNHQYHVYQILDVTPSPTPTPQGSQVTPTPAGIGGQQQGTLTFDTSPYVPPQTSCDTLYYDPYGRVFDAVSLEPIRGVNVSLLQKDTQTNTFSLAYAQRMNSVSLNPQSTFTGGNFSFLVVDGDYQLLPSFNGYAFAQKDGTQLAANATKIYSDIYYSDSPAIQQRGTIQHRDIPLQPIDNVGKEYDLEIIAQNQEGFVKNGKQMLRYSGSISHPFAKLDVSLCSRKIGESTETCNFHKSFNAAQGGPDNEGVFSIELDQAELKNGGTYQISFTKQSLISAALSRNSGFGDILVWLQSLIAPREVHAQSSKATVTYKLEPIVAYIEGYAYGSDGSILPNAQVNILIPFAEVPVFITYTDKTGYYQITSDHLPKSAYSIAYIVGSKESVRISPSQFLTQNTEFTQLEKIDPMRPVTESTNPRKNIKPSYIPSQQISPLPSQPTSPQSQETPQEAVETATERNPIYLIGAILLLLVGGAGALLAVHIYKKKATQDI